MTWNNFIEWVKNFFKESELQINSTGYYYVVSLRGLDIVRTLTKQEAEDYIREKFEQVDSRKRSGNGFGSTQNVSNHRRWSGFRNQFKITRYCGICGMPGQGCGQC